MRNGLLERIARGRDGAEICAAARLHVLPDRAVECHQLLEQQSRAACKRLVLALHAAYGHQGGARGAPGEHLTGNQHRGHGGQSEEQPPADAQAQAAQPPRRQCRAWPCRRRARWEDLSH